MNYGLRYQFETFPSAALNNPMAEFDPRAGFAYNFGTKYNIVLRGGARPRIAVVQRRKDNGWVLPKGKLKSKESAISAARREPGLTA